MVWDGRFDDLDRASGTLDESVLIYDLGGGTFDVTVAKISPSGVEVLSTSGDHDLGGKNWDDRIASVLAERFQAATGFDPLDDPVMLNEVLSLAEQAKWALSERTSTRVALQLGKHRQSFELTRAEFDAMTSPLMDRTRRLTEEALGESGLTWGSLVGGLAGRRLDPDADGPDVRPVDVGARAEVGGQRR